jgi:hypothetical protein
MDAGLQEKYPGDLLGVHHCTADAVVMAEDVGYSVNLAFHVLPFK